MEDLLRSAGFTEVRERDVTPSFTRTTRAFLETSERYREELAVEWGADKFAEGQRDRRATLALIAEGIIRRGMFTGRRPARRSRHPRGA